MTPQQLFTWRRETRQTAALPAFVPAVTAPEPMAVDPARAEPPRRCIRRSSSRRRAVGIGREEEMIGPFIPLDAMPGRGRLLGAVTYDCNPLQRALGWSITTILPPL